jgi:hypothetical protein
MIEKSMDKVYGCIYKKEFLTTVKKNILPGSFVMKIWMPFHGMQDKMQLRNIPEFYFIVMQEDHPLDDIIKAAEKIELKTGHLFDAVGGDIYVAGITHPVIRIKLFDKKLLIKSIQGLFADHGFDLSMNQVIIKKKGVIKLKKYFSIEEVGRGIYFDRKTPELAYFSIPHQIEWDLFEDITKRIRVNVALGDFDTAIGAFHIGDKVEYIIRVLKAHRSVENIDLIRKEYNIYINKPESLNINAV